MVLIPNNASLAIEAKDNSTLIATAGEKGKVYDLRCVNCVHYSLKLILNYLIVGFIGIIKIRDLPNGKCVKEFGCINVVDQGELSEGATPPGYTQLLYHNQLDSIIAVTVDHNIIIYGLPKLETKKQVSHLNDVCVMGMLCW